MGFLLSSAQQLLLPRLIGVSSYGYFGFVSSVVTSLFGIFEPAFGNCFYSKISANNKKPTIYYTFWLIFICYSMCVFSVGIFICEINSDISYETILYIFIYVVYFLTQFSNALNKIIDATAHTVKGELCKLIYKFIFFILFFILFYNKINSLLYFLYSYIFSQLILNVLFLRLLLKEKCYIFCFSNLKNINSLIYSIKEHIIYSRPLLFFFLISSLIIITDRSLVQYFYGVKEQAYLTFGFQFNACVFVLVSCLTPIFMREFSIFYKNNDKKNMVFYFTKIIPLMASLVAIPSFFVFLNSDFLLPILAGNEFEEGTLCFAFVSLLPIHQVYAQLDSSIYFCTERTKSFNKISTICNIFFLIIGFLLILPTSHYGFGLGAIGLSIKMLVLQYILFLSRNISNCIFFKFPIRSNLFNTHFYIFNIFAICYITYAFSDYLVITPILKIATHMLLYCLTLFTILIFKPDLFGLSNEILKKIPFYPRLHKIIQSNVS